MYKEKAENNLKNKMREKTGDKVKTTGSDGPAGICSGETASGETASGDANHRADGRHTGSRWYLYVLLFVLSFCIYVAVLVIGKCYPFGEYSFLRGDAYDQYYSMFELMLDWLNSSDKSVFLWNSGMGVDFYLNMLYYGMSPFNLIIILFGKGNLELAMILTIILKASLISVTTLYFFLHTNKCCNREMVQKEKIFPWIAVACTLAYSFCGFILAYGNNIIWLDGLMLVPVIAIGIEKMGSGRGSICLYVVALTLAIVTNFYFSVYLCMFALIYFLLENRESFGMFVRSGLKFAGASILAALISAVVLIPAALCIMNAAKSNMPGFSNNMEMWCNPAKYISSFFPLKELTSDYFYNHNSFCGSIALTGMILFLLSAKNDRKTKIKFFCAVAFLMAGLNNAVLNFILHGMVITHAMGNRFAFILTFIILVMVFRVLTGFTWEDAGKGIGASAVTVVLFVISIVFTDEMQKPVAYAAFMLLTAFFAILFVLCKRKSIKTGTVLVWILSIWCIEICYNAVALLSVEHEDTRYQEFIMEDTWIDTYKELQASCDDRVTALINKVYMTASETNWYSSMSNGYTINAFVDMGLSHYDNVEYTYRGTTPLTSMLYNVQYVVTNEPGLFGGYHTTKTIDAGDDEIQVCEADIKPAFAMVLNKNILSWEEHHNPAENQNSFFAKAVSPAMGGDSAEQTNEPKTEASLFTELDLSGAEREYMSVDVISETDNYLSCRSTSDFYPCIKLWYTPMEDTDLYLYCNDTKSVLAEVWVDGKAQSSGKYYATSLMQHIGSVKAGQEVKIYIHGSAAINVKEEIEYHLYSFENELFQSGIKNVVESCTVKNKMTKGSHMSFEVNQLQSGVLYFALPYQKGFRIYSDGSEKEVIRIGSGLMGIESEEGTHTVDIYYSTPGILPGIAGSLLGVVLFVLVLVFEKKRFDVRD